MYGWVLIMRWKENQLRMASVKTGGLKSNLTRQLYYIGIRMNREVICNEWDKRLYLTALEEARTLFGTEVYAFCVLNDRIRLLTGGKDVKKRTVQRMLTATFERYERETELIGEKDAIPEGTVIRSRIVGIEDAKDAMAVIRFIHLSPYSEGYALSAQDYWWTSYNAYRGHFRWTMADIAPVMRYLSQNDTRPVGTLKEFHRRGEMMRNPIPDCICKGGYEIISPGAEQPQGFFNESFIGNA